MVRRPMVVILLAYLAGCLISGHSLKILIALTIVMYGTIILYMRKVEAGRYDTFLYFVPAFFLLGFLLMSNQEQEIGLQDKLKQDNCYVMVSGVVSEITPAKKTSKVILSNVTIHLKDESASDYADSILVYMKDLDSIHIGNEIFVSGEVKSFELPSNPGQFNEFSYYKQKNIAFAIYEDSHEVKDQAYDKVGQTLYQLRVSLRKVYEELLPEEQVGFVCAMILGEKDQMDEELKQLYCDLGIAHIFAISGLHITLLGMGLYSFLEKLKLSLRLRVAATILFLTLYGILTNFSVSTNRAVVMMVILLVSKVFGKCYDLLSAISFSALIILFQKPMEMTDSGFLLSYLSMIGIAIVAPIMERLLVHEASSKFQKVKQKVFATILFSSSISLATLPVMLNTFYTYSPYSILLNLIIIPLMTFVVILSLIGGIAGLFCITAGRFFIGGAVALLKFYELAAKAIQKLPKSLLITGEKESYQIIFYYVLLGIILYLILSFERKAVLLLTLPILILFYQPQYKGLTTTFLDVGQGDGICMRLPSGHVMMVDGGSTSIEQVGKYRMIPYLKQQGIGSIDYYMVTHSDRDHISGLLEMLENPMIYPIPIKTLLLTDLKQENKDENYKMIEEKAKIAGVKIKYITKGDRLTDGEVTLTCLHPNENFQAEDVNNTSMVWNVRYRNYSMLLVGDLGVQGEQEIDPKQLERFDVLKVGHHGSKNSSSDEFLSKITPEMAIISAGENNHYGHPHKETLKRLKKYKTTVFTTIDSGAIIIKTDGISSLLEQYKSHETIGFRD
ncbi:late competence protein comeC, DNA transport [Lachnospiraceae bacterium KM106-2]|nr:late competence protein comeC, DNA transport [Lachnospiraceae bacterium KM106-2]